MGQLGLISRQVQLECLGVGNVMVPSTHNDRVSWMKRLFLGLLLVSLYSGFFLIKYSQWSGVYRCDVLYVQLGDAYGPYAYYSGRFESQGDSWSARENGRPYYLDETGKVKLSYSTGEGAWLFSYFEEPESPYFIKSSSTITFDVTDVATQTWYAITVNGDSVPMDWLAMTCNVCNTDVCNPEHGTCIGNVCECKPFRMGINCESPFPDCQYFSLDLTTKGTTANVPGASFFLDNGFQALGAHTEEHPITSYDRSIYAPFDFLTELNDDVEQKMDALMGFLGRRWVIFGLSEERAGEAGDVATVGEFRDFLGNITLPEKIDGLQILASWNNLVPLFFSAPVDYGTPSYGYDPSSVNWVFAKKDDSEPFLGYSPNDDAALSARLLCSDCRSSTQCLNGGSCLEEFGYCQCTP